MKLENDFFRFLGIAAKAGRCLYGSGACREGVRSGKVCLVISDAALSQRSKKDTNDMCAYYNIPHIETEPSLRAGAACGKEGIMLIGITDESFKNKLIELSDIRRCDSWANL